MDRSPAPSETGAPPATSSTDSLVGSLANMLAMLAAVAMFFSTLEYLIPKPVPFFRVGLANLPILVVLRFFRPRHVLALTLLKVLGQGLINGTLASYVFLFSLFGSMTSALVMIAVSSLGTRRVSLVGVSTAGAVASNIVQVTLSVLFIFGRGSWVIAPPFLILGTIAGVVVGILAEHFASFSQWLRQLEADYRGLTGPGGSRSNDPHSNGLQSADPHSTDPRPTDPRPTDPHNEEPR